MGETGLFQNSRQPTHRCLWRWCNESEYVSVSGVEISKNVESTFMITLPAQKINDGCECSTIGGSQFGKISGRDSRFIDYINGGSGNECS